MKNIPIKLTVAAAAVAAVLSSCKKEETFGSDARIQFGIGSQTKGLLNNADLRTDGTTVKVYDIISGATTYSPANDRHIDDAVQYISASDSWLFTSNPYYLWPATGNQRFFGWLTHDAVSGLDASELVGSISLGADNKTLRIPASSSLALGPTSTQFDFSYSNTVVRTGDADKSLVQLHLEHLFSSFNFAAKNTSDNDVTITQIRLLNFKNANSATISFESSGTEVSYGTGSVSGTPWDWSGSITVSRNTTVNNITSTASGTPKYYLIWPQADANFTAIDYDENTGVYSPHNGSLCYIELTFNQGGDSITRYLGFPLKAWEAGKRYLFTIEFANKLIQLSSSVLPWDLEDLSINYGDGTVQANTIITWNDKDLNLFYDPARLTDDGHGNLTIDNSLGQSIVNDTEKTVHVKNGMPVKVRFNLNTPEGAEWLISLTGDYQAFTVEKLTDNDIDGTYCDFQLVPKTTGDYASPSRDYKVNIRIVLRLPNGRIVSADPILQGPETEVDGKMVLENQYTIILPKA